MNGIFQPTPQQEETSWRAIGIGVAFVLIVVGAIWIFTHQNEPARTPGRIDPYAAAIQFGDLKLARAESFVGSEVTYLEGKVVNTGAQTVIAMQVEIIFRNSLGEVVQKETLPLRVRSTELGSPDFVALSASPLTPNQSREFRFIFEHISADWNQGYPELNVINTKLR